MSDNSDLSSVDSSVWDNISFVLVNESVRTINDFEGSILLLEFSSTNCLDCSTQLPILDEFWETISSSNESIVLLTLFIDLSTQKELLDYYISNNVTWLVGRIDYSTYSTLGLSFVPSFHLFDRNSNELKSVQTNLSLKELWDFVNWYPSTTSPVWSIYHKHKEFLNNHLSKSSLTPFVSPSTLSYVLDDIRSFYCLANDLTSYRTLSAQAVSISDHAYFFVEQGIISAYGYDFILNVMDEQKEIFENQIYPVEYSVFGNIEGNLGNIGDGKVIILFANLPSGIAGYFDPFNEYSQSFLDSQGLSIYKSNEFEMVILDFLERFETTLAHEYQHLIHFNHDQDELTWFDEGCAELAGYLTNTMPTEWDNLSYFARNYFQYSYDDSLVFWNYLSSGGNDVRIDYGGAYLFLLYFYEQFGSGVLTTIVNDTYSSIVSLSTFLSTVNLTFNDFFFNWQLSLFLDHLSLSNSLSFTNLDFSLSPLSFVSDETVKYYSIPYYGFYSVLVDISSTSFDIVLINSQRKNIGITLFFFSGTNLIDFQWFTTSNSSIDVVTTPSTTSILISLSHIDEFYPLKAGNNGLGDFVPISLQTINPFQLHYSYPTILQNKTHFSLYDLHILFLNGTDIFFGGETDLVVISVIGSISNDSWFPVFDLGNYFGWGGCWSLSSLLPGSYDLFLNITTGNFSLYSYLSCITLSLDLELSRPLIFLDNVSMELQVSVNLTLFPSSLIDEILPSSSIHAFIYNSDKMCVSSFSLHSLDQNTYSGFLDCSNFSQDYYYSIICFEFEDFIFYSFPSELIHFSPSITDNVSSLNIVVFPLIMMIIVVIKLCLKNVLKSINKKELIKNEK